MDYYTHLRFLVAPYLVIFVLLSVCADNSAAARQADEQDQGEKIDKILQVSDVALRTTIKNRVNQKIDFYVRFFDLQEDQVKKARIYAKRIATDHGRMFKTPVSEALTRMIRETDGNVFYVDDEPFFYDEDGDLAFEENARQRSGPQLQFILSEDASAVNVRVRYGNSTSSRRVIAADNEPLKFDDNTLRNSIKALKDKDYEKADQYLANLKKENYINAYRAILSNKLELTPDQEELLKPWIKEQIEFDAGQPYMAQLRMELRRRTIFGETPDFLDETQKVLWERLKKDTYPGEW